MVGFTASWVHGNSVVMDAPPREDGGVFAFNHFGWGAQITMRPGFSRWFHIAIPAPVMLDGQRMNLIRTFLQFRLRQLWNDQRCDLVGWSNACSGSVGT